MKTLILAICISGAFLVQGCEAYVEPAGGYYVREGVWYYHDDHGIERREHGRWHHRPEDEHHDEHH